MSFQFNWPPFDQLSISDRIVAQLESALNKGPKPAHICDAIQVKQLRMGSVAPELDILEIAELSADKFKGTFRLGYGGDASLLLQTKVQVNPVTRTEHLLAEFPPVHGSAFSLLGPYNYPAGAAHQPLVVPMQLQISALKLNALITLTVDKFRGVTICFKNDPVESVRVSSTFDDLASVRKMLQQEIERKLRALFSDDIPEIIHQMSLDYLGVTEPTIEETLKQRQSGSIPSTSTTEVHETKISQDSGLGESVFNSAEDLSAGGVATGSAYPSLWNRTSVISHEHTGTHSTADASLQMKNSPRKTHWVGLSQPDISGRSALPMHRSHPGSPVKNMNIDDESSGELEEFKLPEPSSRASFLLTQTDALDTHPVKVAVSASAEFSAQSDKQHRIGIRQTKMHEDLVPAIERLALTKENLSALHDSSSPPRRKSSATRSAAPRFVGLGELSLRTLSKPMAASEIHLNLNTTSTDSGLNRLHYRVASAGQQRTTLFSSLQGDSINAKDDRAETKTTVSLSSGLNRSIIMHRWSTLNKKPV